MKKIIICFVALLVIAAAATGPVRAQQQTYTVTFAANNNTKTVENVTLPHTFSASYNTANEEFDLILKELYGWSGNPNYLYPATYYDLEVSDGTKVVSTKPDNYTQCLTINNVFEGSVTVNGTYVVDGSEVEYTVAISISAPALYTVTFAEGTEDVGSWSITPAAAATAGVAEGTEVTITYNGTRKVKEVVATVTVPTYVDLATLTADYEAQNGDVLINTLAGNYKITIADGATVTLKNATITYSANGADYAGLTLLGDGTIVLTDGTTNTVVGGLDGDGYSNWSGIYVPEGKTLTINGNTGVLNAARGGDDTDFGSPAGIGASWKNPCGNIVINGGVINAVGGAKSAGIGGTFVRTCGDITINGGTITATGHKWGSGIGLGGTENASSVTALSGCNITITGGTVTATGGWGGAGIGTGYADHKTSSLTITLGDILISGGTVTATGGEGAAGIGTGGTYSGNSNNCGTITITDGVTSVTATKGLEATDCIGKGSANGTCGTVTIGGTTGAISTSPYTYTPNGN